jgi:uncharacterized OB-fold protein
MSGEQSGFRGTKSQGSFPYRYSAGEYGTRFFAALKEGKFLASHCTHCKATLVPCRLACARCFRKMTEFREVPGTGRIASFTQVNFSFLDPFTGEKRPVPYCFGRVELDGADDSFMGYFDVKDFRKLRIGMRVRAVFNENRVGAMSDFSHFEVIHD